MSNTIHPWVLPLGLALIAVVFAVGWWRRSSERPKHVARWVANSEYIAGLPAYRSRMTVLRTGLVGLVVMLLLAAVGTSVLLARPAERQLRAEELATRDIVLCLDVSGSMIEFASEIVEKFDSMVESFQGERIALVVWNSTSRTVFPLTDDYALITEELAYAADVLDFHPLFHTQSEYDALFDFLVGTQGGPGDSSSLVGDGLASCALSFDEAETERSRSIILASDNEVFGSGVFTLAEAAELAGARDIQLYGLFTAGWQSYSAANEQEFRDVIESNDGLYYDADDPSAIPGIIEDVTSQQAVALDADHEVVIIDYPERVLWLAALGVVGIVLLGWAVRT